MCRFQFSIIVPGNIAPHNGGSLCPGKIKQDIYAEVSGLESASTLLVHNPSHDVSSPLPTFLQMVPSNNAPRFAPVHAGTELATSRSNRNTSSDGRVIAASQGLHGTVKAYRGVRVRYNPNRDGTFSQLEDRLSALVPGIGVSELEMVSAVVSSVSSPDCPN